MVAKPRLMSFLALGILNGSCLGPLALSPPGPQRDAVERPSEVASSNQSIFKALAEFPCLNSNMIWRFVKSGIIECKTSTSIDFIDQATKKPLMGALYSINLEVYLSIPLKNFVTKVFEKTKTVTLNSQTIFVKLQLADDVKNERPITAMVKVTPSVKFTLQEVCSLKLEDLDLKIEEIKSPDLGLIGDRIPGIVNGMVAIYKTVAIEAVQSKIHAVSQSKFCWYYRDIFHKNEPLPTMKAPEPSSQEKVEAQGISSGAIIKPEAEKSEVETYNAKKWQETSAAWDCKWFGGC